ncbi:zinc finger protein 667-like isoform X2 [Lineus longissimus]
MSAVGTEGACKSNSKAAGNDTSESFGDNADVRKGTECHEDRRRSHQNETLETAESEQSSSDSESMVDELSPKPTPSVVDVHEQNSCSDSDFSEASRNPENSDSEQVGWCANPKDRLSPGVDNLNLATLTDEDNTQVSEDNIQARDDSTQAHEDGTQTGKDEHSEDRQGKKCQTVSISPNKSMSCRKCEEKFSKPSLLDLHYKDVHGMDAPYQCWRCSFQTAEYLAMERHMDACTEPLHCVECGDMFDNAQMLLEHKIEEHSKDPILKIKIPKVKLLDGRRKRVRGQRSSSRLENATAKRVTYLEEDIEEEEEGEEHEIVPPLKLRTPKVQKTRSKKRRGKTKSVPDLAEPKHEDSTSGTLYLCPRTDTDCSFQTMNMNNLMSHLRCHEDGTVYACPYKDGGCTYQTEKRGNLRSHLKTHLRVDEDRYKCEAESCDFKCNKNYLLVRHKKSVHGFQEKRDFECEICNKKFTRNQRLQMHLRIHANESPYICDQCGKTFASKQWLNVHLKIHHGTEKYICETCSKSFPAKTYLAKHRKTHEEAKKFLCDVCPKAFKRSDHLQCHKRMHTGEKPFLCNQCGKTFKQICGLQAHKKVHSGEKPYVCTVCAKAFTYNSSLRGGLCNFCRSAGAKAKADILNDATIATVTKFSESRHSKGDTRFVNVPIFAEAGHLKDEDVFTTAPKFTTPNVLKGDANFSNSQRFGARQETTKGGTMIETAPKFRRPTFMRADKCADQDDFRNEPTFTTGQKFANQGTSKGGTTFLTAPKFENTMNFDYLPGATVKNLAAPPKYDTGPNFPHPNYQMGPNPMQLAAAAAANFMPPNMQYQ